MFTNQALALQLTSQVELPVMVSVVGATKVLELIDDYIY